MIGGAITKTVRFSGRATEVTAPKFSLFNKGNCSWTMVNKDICHWIGACFKLIKVGGQGYRDRYE